MASERPAHAPALEPSATASERPWSRPRPKRDGPRRGLELVRDASRGRESQGWTIPPEIRSIRYTSYILVTQQPTRRLSQKPTPWTVRAGAPPSKSRSTITTSPQRVLGADRTLFYSPRAPTHQARVGVQDQTRRHIKITPMCSRLPCADRSKASTVTNVVCSGTMRGASLRLLSSVWLCQDRHENASLGHRRGLHL